MTKPLPLGGALWSDGSNWETGNAPTINDDAIIITDREGSIQRTCRLAKAASEERCCAELIHDKLHSFPGWNQKPISKYEHKPTPSHPTNNIM